MGPPGLGDPRFVARATLALARANVRYWTSVAPLVHGQLRRWQRRAEAIGAPELRALALQKLHGEGFHAEAGAMLATLAPRGHRRDVVEAIVALELLFDYLDGLTERPTDDPLRDGQRLFAPYVEALGEGGDPAGATSGQDPWLEDGGYLQELSGAVRAAIARLPAAPVITPLARRSALRSAQAQIRMHGAQQLGMSQLEGWARREANDTELGWRELLAGSASSVLAIHALIAAAADAETTSEQAADIDASYLSTCVLLTLLDGVVDRAQDSGEGRPGYLELYEDRAELSEALGHGARLAVYRARRLAGGADHLMVLVGVVAYYCTAPGANSELARPLVAQLRRELRPLLSPTLALMRGWRTARRMRGSAIPASGED
jgi:tetraprenyl-beta-curcumene synthase